MSKPKVIAVDMDGTLTNGMCWDEKSCYEAKPNQRVIDCINNLSLKNFIVIHTARRRELYTATVDWLEMYGVRYHAIRMEKMPADCYVDDLSVNPNNENELSEL